MATDILRIHGGRRLTGSIDICGGKNPALAVVSAALLTDSVCVVDNLPNIVDLHVMKELMISVGADVVFENGVMTINASGVNSFTPPASLVEKIHGSAYFLGALLGRLKRANVAIPGGCALGERKMDLHIKGLEALGARVFQDEAHIEAQAERLTGSEIYLDFASVGATVNIMLAATLAEGNTIISNAGKEPHIVDLANMLNAMGAQIKGAGTEVIRIRGVKKLHGSSYTIIPDQIETGTLMIAAAATKGDITIHGAIPVHMEALTAKLLEMGIRVYEGEDLIRVHSTGEHRAVSVKTLIYPGFPTDLQQPMSALLTTADGVSVVNETIFDDRQRHIYDLVKMGADARVEGTIATIKGVGSLKGADVTALNLRHGAALVIAGLMAEGVTNIYSPHHIDRGYENLDKKLIKLGAHIERLTL